MTSTSNSNSSTASTSAEIGDTNNRTDINHSTTDKAANMLDDGNSNGTSPPESAMVNNNIALQFKKIQGERNGWHRLYQVS